MPKTDTGKALKFYREAITDGSMEAEIMELENSVIRAATRDLRRKVVKGENTKHRANFGDIAPALHEYREALDKGDQIEAAKWGVFILAVAGVEERLHNIIGEPLELSPEQQIVIDSILDGSTPKQVKEKLHGYYEKTGVALGGSQDYQEVR